MLVISDFISQVLRYREYLYQSVLRDLRRRYKRSILGYFWSIAHPLMMMIVLATVFSHIMRIEIKDYAIFLFAGLLPWNFFSSTAMMSLHSIRSNARLFSHVPIPKYIFVLSIAASNFVNYLLALIPLLLMILVAGRTVPATIVLLPLVLIPFILAVLGISMLLAASNVFFEDTHHLAEVGMSVLYFLSPVLYHRGLLPQSLVKYLVYNPFFTQIEFIRAVVYDGVFPDFSVFLCNLLASILIFVIALVIFRKVEDKFLYFI
ncbi:ABC transporter permease [bacterium]|nr:ABC transporter permease [bacterium]